MDEESIKEADGFKIEEKVSIDTEVGLSLAYITEFHVNDKNVVTTADLVSPLGVEYRRVPLRRLSKLRVYHGHYR